MTEKDKNGLMNIFDEMLSEHGITISRERYEQIFRFVELRDRITKNDTNYLGYQWLTDTMFAMMTAEQRKRLLATLESEA